MADFLKTLQKLTEKTTFKVGDVVIAKTGPHKGQKHEIIHAHDDGSFNVKPINVRAKDIKYRLGAAKAKQEDLEKCCESVTESLTPEQVKQAKLKANAISQAKKVKPAYKDVDDDGFDYDEKTNTVTRNKLTAADIAKIKKVKVH